MNIPYGRCPHSSFHKLWLLYMHACKLQRGRRLLIRSYPSCYEDEKEEPYPFAQGPNISNEMTHEQLQLAEEYYPPQLCIKRDTVIIIVIYTKQG